MCCSRLCPPCDVDLARTCDKTLRQNLLTNLVGPKFCHGVWEDLPARPLGGKTSPQNLKIYKIPEVLVYSIPF